MGNYINRILSRISGNLDENDEIQSITEQKFASDDNTTCTPLSNNTRMLIDPRSATSGILRTPIEVKKGLKINTSYRGILLKVLKHFICNLKSVFCLLLFFT